MDLWIILFSCLGFIGFIIAYAIADTLEQRRFTGLGSIVMSLITCGVALWQPITLGPDLKGGTVLLVRVAGNPSAKQVQQAADVIRRRLDYLGTKEVSIVPEGTDRLKIEVAGYAPEDVERTKATISKVAKLEFRIGPDDGLSQQLVEKAAQNHGVLPLPEAAQYEVLPYIRTDKDGKVTNSKVAVNREVGLTGHHVVQAFASYGKDGSPEVAFTLDSEGGQIFANLNLSNLGKNLAVILDGEVRSMAHFQSDPAHAILNGQGVIENMGSRRECEELASIFENPLDTPIEILSTNVVEASLGADSIRSGLESGVLALILVVGFMVIYYRTCGMIAVIALAVNLVLLFGLMDQMHFTLTLPGIAGIVLTIGMAVDANVLIYERIRDELANGKTAKTAIDLGFQRAFSAIFDSNMTTLIPAMVLSMLGTGPLRGFAITLVLGIFANLFAALIVTRNSFDWILSRGDKPNLSMMQFIKSPRIDFMSYRKAGLALSFLVLVGGLIAGYTRGDALLGVDFKGGDSVTAGYTTHVEISDVRKTLDEAGYRDAVPQYAATGGYLLLQTDHGEGMKAVAALQKAFPQAGFSNKGIDEIGAAVGEEMRSKALTALVLGLVGILIFAAFRFEWSYAIAAAVGQLHDVLIALSIMAMMGSELTLPLVGAFLTIAGYSINDKIVVFDRIREGVKMKEKGTFYEAINRSLNLTLARTILTGGTCLLATLALIIFGGPVIHDFSLAMFIGITSGIYSSHFISPGLAWWLEREAADRPVALNSGKAIA